MAFSGLQTFPVPASFPELIKGFTRELLRDQPADIYEYGFEFFLAMEQVSYFSES